MQNIFMVGSISGWGGCLSEPAEMKLQVWRLIERSEHTKGYVMGTWSRDKPPRVYAKEPCWRDKLVQTKWTLVNFYVEVGTCMQGQCTRCSIQWKLRSFWVASERTNLIPTEFHAINMLWRQNWRSSSPQQNFLALGTLHEENCYFLLPSV